MVSKADIDMSRTSPSSPAERVVAPLRRVRRRLRTVRTDNRFVSRYLFNAGPVWRHRRDDRPMGGEMARVVEELRSSGVATTSVLALLGSEEVLREMQEQVSQLRAQRAVERDPLKPYLVELFGPRPQIDPGRQIFSFALLPPVRGVAEAYAGMELRVQDLNVWINLPTGDGPTQSQRWHRDLPDDHDIIKCFVYLGDVTQGAGPLQYIRTTNTPQGRRQTFASEFDGVGYRVADEDVEATYSDDQVLTAAGPAGTVVFADTRGLHRGGFAADTERVVLQITYSSNASVKRRNLVPAPGVPRAALQGYRLARSR